MNKRLAEAARRIFGNLPHSNGRSGNKVLRKNMIGHKIAAYYPTGKIPGRIDDIADKRIPDLNMNEKKEWVRWKREDNATREVPRFCEVDAAEDPSRILGVYPVKKGQGKRAGMRK